MRNIPRVDDSFKPAQTYADVTAEVNNLIDRYSFRATDRRVVYMIARAALLALRAKEGDKKASETAYKLADEIATLAP